MLIASCPACREPVRLNPSLPADSELACPWCREQRTLGEILDQLPPMMEVVSVGRGAPQAVGALSAVGASAATGIGFDSSPVNFDAGVQWDSGDAGVDVNDFGVEEDAVQLEPIDSDGNAEAGFEIDEVTNFDNANLEPMASAGIEHEIEDQADVNDYEEIGYEEEDVEASSDSEFHVEYGEEEDASSTKLRRVAAPRKQRSPIFTILGVIGGGLLAVPLAGGFLYWYDKNTLPDSVLAILGDSKGSNPTLPSGGVPPRAVPSMGLDSEPDPNASMEDVLASKGFAPLASSDSTDTDITELPTDDNSLTLGSEPTIDAAPAIVNPLGDMRTPELTMPSPTASVPTPEPTIELPADTSLPEASSVPEPSIAEIDPSILGPVSQAVAEYSKLPNPTDKNSAVVYMAVAKLAAELPADAKLPPVVDSMLSKVIENPGMNAHLAKIEKTWWEIGASKMKVPGMVAVGKLDAEGKTFSTESGLKLTLTNPSTANVSQRAVLLGKIEGEGAERTVTVANLQVLSE